MNDSTLRISEPNLLTFLPCHESERRVEYMRTVGEGRKWKKKQEGKSGVPEGQGNLKIYMSLSWWCLENY